MKDLEAYTDMILELEEAACEFAIDHTKSANLAQARAEILEAIASLMEVKKKQSSSMLELIKSNLQRQRTIDTRRQKGSISDRSHRVLSKALKKEVEDYVTSIFGEIHLKKRKPRKLF
jgi:hypothetical protein